MPLKLSISLITLHFFPLFPENYSKNSTIYNIATTWKDSCPAVGPKRGVALEKFAVDGLKIELEWKQRTHVRREKRWYLVPELWPEGKEDVRSLDSREEKVWQRLSRLMRQSISLYFSLLLFWWSTFVRPDCKTEKKPTGVWGIQRMMTKWGRLQWNPNWWWARKWVICWSNS